MVAVSKPLFLLGRLLSTPGALAAFEESGQTPLEFVQRHASGDWGDLCDEDRHLNDEAVENGSRILSAYILPTKAKVWIITEATNDQGQRAATTILLPAEY